MHIVEFQDNKSFGRALSILHYEVRGTFFVKPERKIIVGEEQFGALKNAGLVATRTAPLIPQEEIVIERSDVKLM